MQQTNPVSCWFKTAYSTQKAVAVTTALTKLDLTLVFTLQGRHYLEMRELHKMQNKPSARRERHGSAGFGAANRQLMQPRKVY